MEVLAAHTTIVFPAGLVLSEGAGKLNPRPGCPHKPTIAVLKAVGRIHPSSNGILWGNLVTVAVFAVQYNWKAPYLVVSGSVGPGVHLQIYRSAHYLAVRMTVDARNDPVTFAEVTDATSDFIDLTGDVVIEDDRPLLNKKTPILDFP